MVASFLAPPDRGIKRFRSRASFSAKPLMFAGFSNRTAGQSRGLSLMSILMKAGSLACDGMPVPSMRTRPCLFNSYAVRCTSIVKAPDSDLRIYRVGYCGRPPQRLYSMIGRSVHISDVQRHSACRYLLCWSHQLDDIEDAAELTDACAGCTSSMKTGSACISTSMPAVSSDSRSTLVGIRR